MKQVKHRYKEKTKKQKIKLIVVSLFTIFLISVALIISLNLTYGNTKQPESNEIIETPVTEEPEQIEPEQFEIVDTSDLPQKYQGHTVLGKIVIEKLGVTQKILEDTTNESLNLGVTKFWGPDLNEPRQFISGRA